ncbi:MAG TPA: hypothetical protein VKY27_07595 [Bacteriovoracaceae bacterium]|nr:hypothetical protein [Bacteriovoracaceae bacterium]
MKYLSLITLTALLGLASCGHFSKGHCCHKKEKVCKEYCKKNKKECKEKCHRKSKMKEKQECGDHCKKPDATEKKS